VGDAGALESLGGMAKLRGEALGIGLDRGEPLGDLARGLVHVPDLGLEPADLRIGLVEARLLGMDRIAGLVVGGAPGLDLGLQRPLFGDLLLERGPRGRLALAARGLVAASLLAAHEPVHPLLALTLGLELAEALGNFGLALEPLDLVAELAADVLHAVEVLAGVGEPVARLAPALLVLRHARGFLEEDAQLLGPGLDDPGDHALPYGCV